MSPNIQYGVLLYGLSPKTRLQKIILLHKKLIRIALRLSPGVSVMANFEELKIGTVFEYHNYEVFNYFISEMRNGFKNLKVGAQSRQTRNRNLNVWNFAAKTDLQGSHGKTLMNALCKWGVLPPEKKIYVKWMKNKFKTSITKSQIYIFWQR